jgi:hypothetical protein
MTKRRKTKIEMVGVCPNCGAKLTRTYPIDAAVCLCKNIDVVLVSLAPVFNLSDAEYAKFQRLSELSGVTVEKLFNELMKEAARYELRQWKLFPQVVVSVSKCGGE